MSSQDIKSTNLNLVFMNGSTTTDKSPSKLLSRFGVVWICVEKSNEYRIHAQIKFYIKRSYIKPYNCTTTGNKQSFNNLVRSRCIFTPSCLEIT